jgi:hypothetical protein
MSNFLFQMRLCCSTVSVLNDPDTLANPAGFVPTKLILDKPSEQSLLLLFGRCVRTTLSLYLQLSKQNTHVLFIIAKQALRPTTVF